MIAAAGAGPKPIPHKTLSVDNLVEAIQYCVTPQASDAAQQIAAKMRTESGVKSAVASFHANLPALNLECDLIKGQPAVWTYKSKGTRVKMSKLAAELLSTHRKIDHGSLKMYVVCAAPRQITDISADMNSPI